MYNHRPRRCSCLYNNQNNDNNSKYETLCDNIPCNLENYNSNCNCGFDDDLSDDFFPENPMFGQSYVPIQTLNNTFMPNCGLDKGTIFPELVSPYYPGWSMNEIEYLKNTNEIKEGCNR